jgi:vacuolar-type H+-ATPase subunit I/STV1
VADLRVERARAELEAAEAALRDAVRARGAVVASMPDAARRASETAEAERAARERFEAAQVALRGAEQAMLDAVRGPQAKARDQKSEYRRRVDAEIDAAWAAASPAARLASVDARIAALRAQIEGAEQEMARARTATAYAPARDRCTAARRELDARERERVGYADDVERAKEPDEAKRRAALEARRAELTAERADLESRARDLHRRRNIGGVDNATTRNFQREVGKEIAAAVARLDELHRELLDVERRLGAERAPVPASQAASGATISGGAAI